MDIIRDLKQKKKRKELGSEKQSQGNTFRDTNETDLGENMTIVQGEVYKMADDLEDLPEFDPANPEMKTWMEQEEKRQRENLANVSREEAIAFVDQLVTDKRGTPNTKNQLK